MRLVRGIMLYGARLGGLLRDIYPLGIFLVGILALAILKFYNASTHRDMQDRPRGRPAGRNTIR